MASAQGKYRPGQHPVNQNPADYPIKLHISATHFRPYGLYVDAILDGKKVELSGWVDSKESLLIVPGDYLALLPKKLRDGGGAALGQQYYVLLPDKTSWTFVISGFSE
jgi:hypothetical protein